jgi:hypothetical protein
MHLKKSLLTMRQILFCLVLFSATSAFSQKQWGYYIGPNLSKTIQYNKYYDTIMPHLTREYSAKLGAGLGFQFIHRTSKLLDIRIEPHFQMGRYTSRSKYYEDPKYGRMPYYYLDKITDIQLGINLNTGIAIIKKPDFNLRVIGGLHGRAYASSWKTLESNVVNWEAAEGRFITYYSLGFGPNAGWEITFNRKGGLFAIQNTYSLSLNGLSTKNTSGFGIFTAALGVGYRFSRDKIEPSERID